MPKKQILREYDTDIAMELIRKWIHNRVDRRMLYLRLIDGCTFNEIADIIFNEEGITFEDKTVRTRIHKGEEIIFRHYP